VDVGPVSQAAELARLLWGTVVHRPYVYAFLACFLAFAGYQLGARRTATFALTTFLIAFAAEYSSTRNGFPFGFYRYFDDTRGRELWISNVPFWDSLSFVFLSYFAFALAAALLSPAHDRARGAWPGVAHPSAPVLGGVLMMLLDVVIDPVALQGDRWFLGRIYDYPHRGFYFGVTAANFAGWFLVGLATQGVFQRSLTALPWCRGPLRPLHPLFGWGVVGVYAGVFLFNLGVTVAIGDLPLAAASSAVVAATLGAVAPRLRGPRPAKVLVCAATETEARACRRGIRDAGVDGFDVLATGVGPRRANDVLRARLAAGPPPALVVSSGFAGSAGIERGALVTADAVAWLRGQALTTVAARPGTLRLAPDATPALVVTSDGVLVAPPPVGRGAAFDMESTALAEVAFERGVPFAVFRLVTDSPSAPLPPIARSAARALAARSASDRLLGAARVAADALARPRDAVALARGGIGWSRALREAWRVRAAAFATELPVAPDRLREGLGG
jgi:putative membrane protein